MKINKFVNLDKLKTCSGLTIRIIQQCYNYKFITKGPVILHCFQGKIQISGDKDKFLLPSYQIRLMNQKNNFIVLALEKSIFIYFTPQQGKNIGLTEYKKLLVKLGLPKIIFPDYVQSSLAEIVLTNQIKTYRKGLKIYSQNQQADTLFLIINGSAILTRQPNGRTVQIGCGQYIGLESILCMMDSKVQRVCTAISKSLQTQLLPIKLREIQSVISKIQQNQLKAIQSFIKRWIQSFTVTEKKINKKAKSLNKLSVNKIKKLKNARPSLNIPQYNFQVAPVALLQNDRTCIRRLPPIRMHQQRSEIKSECSMKISNINQANSFQQLIYYKMVLNRMI